MAKSPVNFKILLDQVNKIRIALLIGEGKLEQLPKGERFNQKQCVLARALSNGWTASIGSDEIRLSNRSLGFEQLNEAVLALKRMGFKAEVTYNKRWKLFPTSIPTPYIILLITTATMSNFIHRFDEGDFPWLILEKD